MNQLNVPPSNKDTSNLEFDNLPHFPDDISVAPLLRISLRKLQNGTENEIDRLWKASCKLGFFYLDLRDIDGQKGLTSDANGFEEEELTRNVWGKDGNIDSPVDSLVQQESVSKDQDVTVDGRQLLENVDNLFRAGEEVFELPVQEKIKYDLKDQGSYFGYKGYGQGVIDAQGTKDRNEFYNVSKDDILGISSPLPAPEVLNPHREELKSFIEQSHAIVTLLLRLLTSRLGLPSDSLTSLHKLESVSGDQVRWVYAPPQPFDDSKVALGQHTDFGSITILFNRLGGLQVLPPDSKEWCYVKPLRGHAIVNLGDAMVKFTAGILRSNIHRVISPPGKQADLTRMSLVYFARPEDDVMLKVLEGSDVIDEKRKQGNEVEDEEAITSKEWVLRRALGRRQGGDWEKSVGTEGGRVDK